FAFSPNLRATSSQNSATVRDETVRSSSGSLTGGPTCEPASRPCLLCAGASSGARRRDCYDRRRHRVSSSRDRRLVLLAHRFMEDRDRSVDGLALFTNLDVASASDDQNLAMAAGERPGDRDRPGPATVLGLLEQRKEEPREPGNPERGQSTVLEPGLEKLQL